MGMWITVAERMPPELEMLVVAQSLCQHGRGWRVFAGWLSEGCWLCHMPKSPAGEPGGPFTAEMGDLRATDFWMNLPGEPRIGAASLGR